MSDNTVLVLSAVGLPPYSARGLTQTVAPIAQAAQLRRTVNGALVDLAEDQFQKYASTVSGDDQQPPALDLVWPGQLVTVDCLFELAAEADTDTLGTDLDTDAPSLGRDFVPGSLREEDGFVFYRPRLSMRVTSFTMERDEWQAGDRWSIGLEEV